MTAPTGPKRSISGRREPPPFRLVHFAGAVPLSARMLRVTLSGEELEGLVIAEPAASVRLLVPQPGADLVIPEWHGNELLLRDGSRPIIRTFTPRRFDPELRRLDIDVVVHPGGAVVDWIESAQPGDAAAVSGPGRGFTIDAAATDYLLAGDETAIPAISQLLEALPHGKPVQVHIEIAAAAAAFELPHHPATTIRWHELQPGAQPGDALVQAVANASLGTGTHVWCAGEAAGMHRIRNHLFKERSHSRSRATVRGYWKKRATE